jgi:hypothetical protein
MTRMSIQSGKFESGQVWFPNNAPWLADLESELFAFPMAATMTRSTASVRPWRIMRQATTQRSRGQFSRRWTLTTVTACKIGAESPVPAFAMVCWAATNACSGRNSAPIRAHRARLDRGRRNGQQRLWHAFDAPHQSGADLPQDRQFASGPPASRTIERLRAPSVTSGSKWLMP